MDDSKMLKTLADWFDTEQDKKGKWGGKEGNHDVQNDLRRIADHLAAAENERDEWKDAYYKVKKERDIAEAALREAGEGE